MVSGKDDRSRVSTTEAWGICRAAGVWCDYFPAWLTTPLVRKPYCEPLASEGEQICCRTPSRVQPQVIPAHFAERETGASSLSNWQVFQIHQHWACRIPGGSRCDSNRGGDRCLAPKGLFVAASALCGFPPWSGHATEFFLNP